MKFSYIAFLSTQNLRKRKLRSFLTIGGMAIGISSIVFLVSLGFGLQRLITSQVTNLEALTILDVSTGTSTLLQIDDDRIAGFKEIPHVLDVSPSYSISGQVAYTGSVTDIAMFGIQPEYVGLEGITPAFGRVFSIPDGNETVISTTAAELLGVEDFASLIGKTVTYSVSVEQTTDENGAPLDPNLPPPAPEVVDFDVEVIGVVDDELTLAYLPISILEITQPENYDLARVKVDNRDNLVGVRQEIEGLGYQVDSVADTVGQIDRIFLVFEIVMAGFGFIAMLVASLGAFNTLTVSLLERTREVGIMKALGTPSKDVYRLFLSESFLIGFSGGSLGILIGYSLGEIANVVVNYLANRYGGQSVDIFFTPFLLIVVIFSIIVLVSFLTGVYPARRASKLNPLDALRYE
ncbi:MAG: ABC transporter permease [Candidatus Nomurabacteria bacterium]|nr:MAG: ABC transporter permease [Candidatus Nomurabacteria bacterium]